MGVDFIANKQSHEPVNTYNGHFKAWKREYAVFSIYSSLPAHALKNPVKLDSA